VISRVSKPVISRVSKPVISRVSKPVISRVSKPVISRVNACISASLTTTVVCFIAFYKMHHNHVAHKDDTQDCIENEFGCHGFDYCGGN
jgi:hypothetical protein